MEGIPDARPIPTRNAKVNDVLRPRRERVKIESLEVEGG